MTVRVDVSALVIAQMEPEFWEDVETLLTGSPYRWTVYSAYRSLEEQTVLYDKFKAGGPRAAPAGLSAHNYGLAVDVQLWREMQDGNGSPVPDAPWRMEWNVKTPGWQWLFKAVFDHPRLHSGLSFGDFDHVERFNWKEFRDWNQSGGDS